MDKDILLALIAKDIDELSRIFSNVDSSTQLSADYMRLAADKARCLATNIESLIEQQPHSAEVVTEPAQNSFEAEREYIDGYIATAVEQQVTSLVDTRLDELFSDFSQSMVARLSSSTLERENALRREIAEANKLMYEHLHKVVSELSAIPDSGVVEATTEESTPTAPEESIECRPIQQESETELEQIVAEELDTDLAEVSELEEMAVAEEPMPEVESEIEPEPMPEPEQEKTPEDKPVEPVQHQPATSLAETVLPNKATVADSIQTRESILDKLSHREDISLASTLNNKKIDDLKAAISIADRFRFQRELFGGDGERMNKTISVFNSFSSMQEAEEFIEKNLIGSPKMQLWQTFCICSSVGISDTGE